MAEVVVAAVEVEVEVVVAEVEAAEVEAEVEEEVEVAGGVVPVAEVVARRCTASYPRLRSPCRTDRSTCLRSRRCRR